MNIHAFIRGYTCGIWDVESRNFYSGFTNDFPVYYDNGLFCEMLTGLN